MALFRCLIRGENFPGRLIGQDEPVGFYTTRFVEAESPQEAEARAIDLLRADADLALPEKYRTKDAKVYLDEIDEVAPETEQRPNKGFTFFTMGA